MAKFDDLAPRYMALLIADFALAPFQAAAIVGNGGEESGGFEKIQEIGQTSGRGGLGHFQWTGSRRRDFEAWLARNEDKGWQADTFEANYSMLFRELVGPESHTIPALKQTTTLEQATQVFMDKFERPGVPALDVRIKWARKALAAFLAAGSPIKLPPAAQIEVLSPLPKIDLTSLAPLLNAALPILLQVLTARMQQPGGAQTGQQIDPAALLQQLFGVQLQPPPPAPAEPPKPEPAPVVVKSEPKTAVGVGLIGLLGSVLGMVGGQIGTPFGMGEAPTTAGTLAVVIPAAISMIGATGIFGPWGAIAGKVIGAVATSVVNSQAKK